MDYRKMNNLLLYCVNKGREQSLHEEFPQFIQVSNWTKIFGSKIIYT
jgi:hypothetical protein